MGELAASPRYRAYLDGMLAELKHIYDIAGAARKVGLDPRDEVEVPLAADLAGRVEKLLGYEGLAAKIHEVEETEKNREVASLKIADFFLNQGLSREETLLRIIRASMAVITEGAVAAPIEGFVKCKIKKNDDGTEYLSIYFAGPIRSAGGTAQAMSVLAADYGRTLLGLAPYKAREEEIQRYIEEIKQYRSIATLQYTPKDEEIRLIIENCAVCIDGEDTEKEEVSGHRNLERVETNVVRGGMCLVIAEGMCLKAPKIKKNVDAMNKGKEKRVIDGWDWLQILIDGTSSGSAEEEKPGIHPKDKYIRDMLAGRPAFSYPMAKGGFRLRLGRCRNTGFATCGFNPASLHILGDYLSVGTQMKVERPGKACGVVPCDTIEGPTVRLVSGELRRVDTLAEAKRLVRDNAIDYILDIGEILISFGEFMENNHVLAPPSYSQEWWELESDMRPRPENELEALSLVAGGCYLHPDYTWFYDDCTQEQLLLLSDAVSSTGRTDGGVLYIPENPAVKAVLEELLVPHTVENGEYVIRIPLSLIACLGLSYPSLAKNNNWANLQPWTNGLDWAMQLSGFKMRSKAGTRIGGRMGRPGKSAPRKMKPPVHVLFPLGDAGGARRSVVAATKSTTAATASLIDGAPGISGEVTGSVRIVAGERKCPVCGKTTYKSKCPSCGAHTNAVYHCPRCHKIVEPGVEQCPSCGAPCECSKEYFLPIKQEYEEALKELGIENPGRLPEIKGVIGLISKEQVVEPIAKGILRAKNEVFVFRDGTIRYDMIDLPLTHFQPHEINVSVEKLRSIGYTKDTWGAELTDPHQTVELLPQDILVSEDCGNYLVKVAKYIDEELTELYHLKPYYNAETPQDLVGQLIMGLAPHTSAGVLARLVGFTKAKAGYAHPYYHAAKRRNCDGDEDCVMLMMDGILNFSRAFLPSTRGGTMDAPLVLTTILNPNEVDKETRNVDVCPHYPIEVFNACLTYTMPKDVAKFVDHVDRRVGTAEQFEGFKFTHNTKDISEGPLDTAYTAIKSTDEKIKAELALASKIRAVDTNDLAERILNSHLMPDMIGNLRSFSKQAFTCSKCRKKFRRMPVSGKCTQCGGALKATMHRGNVTKYLEIAKYMAENYHLSLYAEQRVKVTEMNIDSTFGEEEKVQMNLSEFF